MLPERASRSAVAVFAESAGPDEVAASIPIVGGGAEQSCVPAVHRWSLRELSDG